MFATEWSCGDWTMASLAFCFAAAVIIEMVKRANNKPPEIAKQTGGPVLGAVLGEVFKRR